MIRTYHGLSRIDTFEERYEYLQLNGIVCHNTFGSERYLNQLLYTSKHWRQIRDVIIIRDDGCDLGMNRSKEEKLIYGINDMILVHHMNPITIDDIEFDRDILYDPDGLICTSRNTHNAIHFGGESLLPKAPIERFKNDTCPWRKQ